MLSMARIALTQKLACCETKFFVQTSGETCVVAVSRDSFSYAEMLLLFGQKKRIYSFRSGAGTEPDMRKRNTVNLLLLS